MTSRRTIGEWLTVLGEIVLYGPPPVAGAPLRWRGWEQMGWIGLLWLTAALYAPSLHFGFIWDDPLWYGRVVGVPWLRLLLPSADYQFYRPATLLFNALWAGPEGVFSAPLMHAFQIAVHLLNVALVARLGRQLRLGRAVTLATAALFALYPPAHQAIAWTAPQQAWVTALLLATLSVYATARRRGWRGGVWLALGLYALALAFQESALQVLPFVILLEIRLWPPAVRRTAWRRLWHTPPAAFVALSAAYLLLWANVPRMAGITRVAFEGRVALYLLQGAAYPTLGFPGGFPTAWQPYAPYLLAATLLGLTALLAYRRRAWVWLWGMLWQVAGLLPTWAGLGYSYVSFGARLLYLGAWGSALMWAGALLPPRGASRQRYLAGAAALALILAQSGLLLGCFNRAYTAGAAHLAEMRQTLAAPEAERLVFVNFPDRYTFKREPYPWGYWGVTLAPVVTPLEAFARLSDGPLTTTTECLALPALGQAERERGPYAVDLRGAPVDEGALYRRAVGAAGVYLSEYDSAGRWRLRYAGKVQPAGSQRPQLAQFGATAALLDAEVRRVGDEVRVALDWRALRTGAYTETVFLHLGLPGAPPVAQADGPPGLGVLPLWAWQPGDQISEERRLSLAGIAPGEYEVRLGLYDWQAQARLPARLSDGASLLDNALILQRVRLE